jgi:hypothetical protein
MPKKTPTIAENPKASATAQSGTCAGGQSPGSIAATPAPMP